MGGHDLLGTGHLSVNFGLEVDKLDSTVAVLDDGSTAVLFIFLLDPQNPLYSADISVRGYITNFNVHLFVELVCKEVDGVGHDAISHVVTFVEIFEELGRCIVEMIGD